MSFSVPTAWDQLTQEQLRYVLRLFYLHFGMPEWEIKVQALAWLYFCHLKVCRFTHQGWLCEEKSSRRTFVLDPEILPSIAGHVSWVTDVSKMNTRLDNVGKYLAVDFKLQELPFGKYLMAENLYQSFLMSEKEECLVGMARILYNVPDEEDVSEFKEEILLGIFMWFFALKRLLSEEFPHLLKPASGQEATISRESLKESVRLQLRLLTKGDVTKQRYILEDIDTWTALAELDAQAKETEEIKKRYGNKQL